MSTGICSCASPSFPNGGDPKCLIEMGTIKMMIFVPRYASDGTETFIDTSSTTIGQDIKNKILAYGVLPEDRFYPQPHLENATFDRTDTEYETLPSGAKAKTGAGGVRTIKYNHWKKQGSNAYLRELKKVGCTALSVYFIDDNGIWGIKDDIQGNKSRGYYMDVETFDAYRQWAVDNTRQKLDVSFDLNKQECEENSFVITNSELGYKATTLRGNLSGFNTPTNPTPSNTTIEVKLSTGNGTAVSLDPITGLTQTAFVVSDETNGTPITVSGSQESDEGTYLLTVPAMTAGNAIGVEVNAPGYDIPKANTVAS